MAVTWRYRTALTGGFAAALVSIVAVRLDVDGAEIAGRVIDSPPGELTTVQFSWRPTSARVHPLPAP